jgi:hypothetical protein
MTGQVAGHQPSCETGGAEHHDIQLTVPAHPFILESGAGTGDLDQADLDAGHQFRMPVTVIQQD